MTAYDSAGWLGSRTCCAHDWARQFQSIECQCFVWYGFCDQLSFDFFCYWEWQQPWAAGKKRHIEFNEQFFFSVSHFLLKNVKRRYLIPIWNLIINVGMSLDSLVAWLKIESNWFPRSLIDIFSTTAILMYEIEQTKKCTSSVVFRRVYVIPIENTIHCIAGVVSCEQLYIGISKCYAKFDGFSFYIQIFQITFYFYDNKKKRRNQYCWLVQNVQYIWLTLINHSMSLLQIDQDYK